MVDSMVKFEIIYKSKIICKPSEKMQEVLSFYVIMITCSFTMYNLGIQ